jgi:16S rRNA (guanine527-N7)-methyltransferase
VESGHASQLIGNAPLVALDIGSGGGSPSLPLKILSPALKFMLVESRSRKCAFLREAVRLLGLADVRVEQARLDWIAHDGVMRSAFDLVTLRAVRPDDEVWAATSELLRPSGRVLWFGARENDIPPVLQSVAVRPPVTLFAVRA